MLIAQGRPLVRRSPLPDDWDLGNLFAGSDVITQLWRHCYCSLPERSKLSTQVYFPPCTNNKCWNIPQQGSLSGGCVATMQRVPMVLISPRLARNQMTEGRENHLLPYLCLKLNRKWGLKFWVTFRDLAQSNECKRRFWGEGGLIGSCGYDMSAGGRTGFRCVRLYKEWDTSTEA